MGLQKASLSFVLGPSTHSYSLAPGLCPSDLSSKPLSSDPTRAPEGLFGRRNWRKVQSRGSLVSTSNAWKTPGRKECERQERTKLPLSFPLRLLGEGERVGDSGGDGGLEERALPWPARTPGCLRHILPDSVTRGIASPPCALPSLPLPSRPAIAALSSRSPRSQSFHLRICTCGGILRFLYPRSLRACSWGLGRTLQYQDPRSRQAESFAARCPYLRPV